MRRVAFFFLALAACSSTTDDGAATTAPMPGDGTTDDGGPANMRADGGADADAAVDAAPPMMVPGLRAEYFTGYLDLALNQVEPSIDHDWGDTGAPSPKIGHDHFSARWTGLLQAPSSGAYTIATESDDGVRVWIDQKLVIDDWHGQFATRAEAMVTLDEAKPVAIRVEYFQLDLKASLRLLWSSASMPEAVIASSFLRAPAAPSGLEGPKPPFTNPVIPFDCPDPGVIEVGAGAFDVVCTGGTFPIRSSRSLVTWQDTGSAILPAGKPPWAANGFRNWAPEIHKVGSQFVAYFTSVNSQNVLSVGAASAPSVTGPFTSTGAPLVEDPIGVIDPTFFEDDDGSLWLLYKIDGNSQGQPTPIFARRLAPDGLSFAPGSAPVQILVNDPNTWEGGVIEAPWVVKHAGVYYVFYSGNVYDSRYRTGVARANSITGPYEKLGAPVLSNNGTWVGPGHGSVVHVGAFDYWVYHAWSNDGSGGNDTSKGRQVLVDRIDWRADGWLSIGDGTPSHTPIPWPGEP